MEKTARLPSVRTTPELREKVDQACQSLGIKYSTVINQLMNHWVTGKIDLSLELDPDFVESAKEALTQPDVQELFGKVAKQYKKNIKDRQYPSAIKI